MKGKISEVAAKILADPLARQQLNQAVNNGFSGDVTVGGKTYKVRRTTEVNAKLNIANCKPKTNG